MWLWRKKKIDLTEMRNKKKKKKKEVIFYIKCLYLPMLKLAFVKNVDYRRVNCHHSQKDHNKKNKRGY